MSITIVRNILVGLSPLTLALMFYLTKNEKFNGGIFRHMVIFGIAVSGSILLTPIVRKFAFAIDALDHPDPRKIHAKPTALIGGLAVFISFLSACYVNGEISVKMKGILISGAIILIVGFIDDLKKGGLPSKVRLLSQIIATAILIHYGVVLRLFTHLPWGSGLSIFLTFIWVIGITNAMNFLDGMDGLASGIAAIAAGTFFIISYQLNSPYLGFISIALSGSCVGFLVHNSKPATVFLGDTGSTTIGFTLAALGILGNWSNGNPLISFSVPVIVLGIPIFDMTYTTIDRFYLGKVRSLGEWFSYTGKDHFHHSLSNIGMAQQHVVLFIYLVGITLGLSAVVITTGSMQHMMLLLVQAACIFLIIAILMRFGEKIGEKK